ncbi:MAG: WbqC family protein [Roseivirga sp.]|nr:WbqC family protein [Roseivirga sp.]
MQKILLDIQYLPSIAYFAAIKQADEVWIEAHQNFVKQSYQNRCRILGANGTQDLSVPVNHRSRKIPIQELTIDYKQKWMNTHWRALQSAYGKSPFFDYYADEIRGIIQSKCATLFEIDRQLMTLCLKYLQIDTPIHFTKVFEKETKGNVSDLRSVIHPKKGLSELPWFKPTPYHQIFGSNFAPNLSVLDLLFCEGPMAGSILEQSRA